MCIKLMTEHKKYFINLIQILKFKVMKIEITTKKILSFIIMVIGEEILRFVINVIKHNLIVDKTFFFTVPLCLTILIGYWIYLQLQKKFEKEKQELLDMFNYLDKSLKKVSYDHSLRIHFIAKCLIYHKKDSVPFPELGLQQDDLKTLGFDDTTIAYTTDSRKTDAESKILSFTNLSNSAIAKHELYIKPKIKDENTISL